ncbi:hypothetical protein PUMCH_003664 [Australozyma saopauloensis]|uniref:HTH TFE/IIEalpha-type domain-containing protein n=1 Tax=Australozyma saopauloensis TaxID=291208 RepID=A0AAX4HCP3_9ASCO|nr:hypothetical protein PUMCH_003664 [[Candida] saopauloensis]
MAAAVEETIRSLIRFVARGFYTRPFILILDAILLHSVLCEDDLVYLLGINRKELRLHCHRLVEDRLIVSHVQKEEHHQRNINRTYYFIHITEAIDAIKWRVHSIVSSIKEEMSLYGNPHGYNCSRCSKKVSQLDAISMLSDDKSSFICDTCGGVLVEDDSLQQASIKQQKLERLMLQVDPIITYLKKIDNLTVEDNDFDTAASKLIPAQSSSAASYSLSTRPLGSRKAQMSQSLQNAASKANATLHVSITASDENYEREQKEKEERRQKLEQNALPSWHSSSTVGNNDGVGVATDDSQAENGTEVKTEESAAGDAVAPVAPISEAERKEREAQDVLAAYYAELGDREAEEDVEEEDDDDFDDFEDI